MTEQEIEDRLQALYDMTKNEQDAAIIQFVFCHKHLAAEWITENIRG